MPLFPCSRPLLSAVTAPWWISSLPPDSPSSSREDPYFDEGLLGFFGGLITLLTGFPPPGRAAAAGFAPGGLLAGLGGSRACGLPPGGNFGGFAAGGGFDTFALALGFGGSLPFAGAFGGPAPLLGVRPGGFEPGGTVALAPNLLGFRFLASISDNQTLDMFLSNRIGSLIRVRRWGEASTTPQKHAPNCGT